MRTFILLSFLLLGLAYWQLSGGAGFAPETWPAGEAADGAATDGAATVATAEARRDAAPPGEAAAQAAVGPDPPSSEGLPADPLTPADALEALAPDVPGVDAAVAEAVEETADQLVDPASDPDLVTEQATEPRPDLRAVTGDAVNVREGPGTSFAVVGRLAQGDRAEVVEARDGWARVRVEGVEGWMSERFLAPVAEG